MVSSTLLWCKVYFALLNGTKHSFSLNYFPPLNRGNFVWNWVRVSITINAPKPPPKFGGVIISLPPPRSTFPLCGLRVETFLFSKLLLQHFSQKHLPYVMEVGRSSAFSSSYVVFHMLWSWFVSFCKKINKKLNEWHLSLPLIIYATIYLQAPLPFSKLVRWAVNYIELSIPHWDHNDWWWW